MTIAAKHLDPVVGVDIHIIMIPTPAGPVPTPLPNPFVGIVMDPFDYAPYLGATVKINGLPRAQAGTGVMNIAHLPLGGPFGPPPGNEGEVFMGSSTVAVDGDAQSHLGLPVISCQSIGIPALPRLKGKPPKSLVLPTSVVLSIPMGPPVLVGGAPTVSLMALGFRAAFALLGPLGRAIRRAQRGAGRFGRAMRVVSARARRAGDALADALRLGAHGRNRINRAICTVTGHPVDVATGKVFTDKIDLELPGAIPFRWERVWMSTSTYRGPLGHGWHHRYDQALYVAPEVILHRNAEGRSIALPPLALGEEYFDRSERLTLMRERDGYALRGMDRTIYRFRDIGRPHNEHVLRSISDAVGHHVQLHYEDRQLIEVVDSAGRSLQLKYDPQGRIHCLSAPHPDAADQRFVVVHYDYDEAGNLTQVRDALNQTASYRYAGHLLSQETDRNGLSFYFEYDALNEHAKCIHTWGDGGIYDHKLSYAEASSVTSVVNSLGYETQYEHRDGLVICIVDALGATTRREYDEHQQLLTETNALNGVTRWQYDARGNVTQVQTPDGARFSATYDRDDPVSARDALGHIWQWRYDEQQRVIERVDPLEVRVQFRYVGSTLAAMVDGLGHVTGFSYDAQDLIETVHSPDGTTRGWSYDRLGRAVRVLDENGNVQQRRYDLLGRVERIDAPDGSCREISHDPEGHVVRVRDARSEVEYSYGGLGRMLSRSEAGVTVRFEYDTEEELTGIANEHGYVYRFELDPVGRVRAESGFDGLRKRYQRDAAGRAVRVLRPAGLESAYQFDAMGRILQIEHARMSDERRAVLGLVKFRYRPGGDLISATNAAASVRFERDALGRVLRELQGAHWVASRFDATGLRSALTSSLGAAITLERNAMGDVMRVRQQDGFEASLQRDVFGLELSRELPGGVQSVTRRNRLGQPVQQDLRAGDAVLRTCSFNWEGYDRLRLVVDAQQGPVQYRHDAFGNLVAATYEDATQELRLPDAVRNLFRREDRSDRRYGPAGQLLESSDALGRTTQYSYDAEGNLIQKRESDQRIWRYEWNAEGTLREVERPDHTRVRFDYDALGRRVAKHYRGQTTRWIWDGHTPLHEWVEGKLEPLPQTESNATWAADVQTKRREAELNALLTRGPPERGSREQPITWLFESGSYAPMARLQGGAQHSIIVDHSGAPVLMTDADGCKVWSADYTVYGELRRIEGGSFACPFRQAGQYEDAETGLYYNRFRYYDPESGQYTSPDPLGLGGNETNFYAYVMDPTVQCDPLGLGCNTHSVYVLRDASGKINYVGITERLPRERMLEHLRDGKNFHHMEVVRDGLTRRQARDIEGSALRHMQADALQNQRRLDNGFYHSYGNPPGGDRTLLSNSQVNDIMNSGLYSVLQ